uniref:PCI domain-containing protein n=1 Tax=Oryza punctata TaxID=4537 RepID=A0A0E0M9W1_ORYPU
MPPSPPTATILHRCSGCAAAASLIWRRNAARYTGRTRVSRLLFVADNCGSAPAMEAEALRMAYDESCGSESASPALHRAVFARIAGRLGPRYTLDQDWADATNPIKEGARMCLNELGDLYYALGQLPDALNNYAKTHNYATTSEHILQMWMNAILIRIELGMFTQVPHYVVNAEQTADNNLDRITVAKLQAAAGLAYLATKDYRFAAWKFTETGLELGDNFSKVIAPEDVAVYGGLCALASFDRSELKSKVIDNYYFHHFLELVPEVKGLVNDFFACRYASCMGYLEELKPNLLLDIYMHEHVETLYKEIRHKAIIHYTLPFIYVDLNRVAPEFKTSAPLLEKELAALITENKIQARIDSHNKILYAIRADERNETFRRVLQTCSEFERGVKSILLRANLLKHGHSRREVGL